MGETTKATTLLLTRPERLSVEFLDLVSARLGPRPPALIAPLARFVATSAPIPDGAAILTSGRAVEAAGDALAGRLAFCVGDRTAELARAAGAHALSAAGETEALIRMVLAARPDRAVHLRGADSAGRVAARLSAAGVHTVEVVVYRTDEVPPPEELRALLGSGRPILAPVFSTRSASRLAAAGRSQNLHVAAISAAAAGPLGTARIAIADRPDAAAMCDLVVRLWHDLP